MKFKETKVCATRFYQFKETKIEIKMSISNAFEHVFIVCRKSSGSETT